MMDWWKNLNQREKLLMSFGGPLLLVVMFYLYMWQPVSVERGQLRLKVPENNATLAWMNHQLAGLKQSPKSTESTDQKQPLLTVIEQAAIKSKIKDAIQRVQPGNDGSVEIWFQEAIADQLFRWIDQLSVNNIAVVSATITRATPGLVSARIKVNRG
ncbi:MAG: type II secretion system protein GspM [bacterium]